MRILRVGWLLLGFFVQAHTSHGAVMPDAWTTFQDHRVAYAADLAKQIEACVTRNDTSYPAFHGCMDWHSAVHGTWALAAYARLTGDKRYDNLVATILTDDNLRLEQAYLEANPQFEMPYGLAWFLRLAVERAKSGGSPMLDAMAARVARSMVSYIGEAKIDVLSQEYDNISWALVNLLDYANYYRNEDIRKFVRTVVRDHYLTFSGRCPIEKEVSEWRGFMAVCTTAAWLVSDAVSPAEFNKWIANFLPPMTVFNPVIAPNSDHQAGLDFSRCWGFWKLYRRTGDTRYFDAFIDHFHENMSHRDRWAGEYRRVGHWVAQFGILAIALTFDDPPP